jgi:hypothetical protein
MSNNDADILELKFEGNGVNPGSVKPHEIAELINSFEKSLLATIKQNNPEIDTENLLFTFESLKNESLGIGFKTIARSAANIDLKAIVIASFLGITAGFNEGNFSSLPLQAISHLKTFTKFSKRHECSGSFKHNNQVISSFTGSTEINTDKVKWLKEETTIFGKLIDSGGENPNVHIKVSDDQTIIFKVSESEAKTLAARLYEKVAVKGIAKFNPKTLEIIEFKLIEITAYAPGKTLAAIKKLRSITNGFWDNFNTNDEINNQLLRD